MRKLLLNCKRIYLETLTIKINAKTLKENINDIKQTKYMYAVPYPYTLEDAGNYIEYLNCITDNFPFELGVVSLNNINYKYGNSEIVYWIKREFSNNGYDKEATQMLIKYAFEELNLVRIYAALQKENTGSLALLTSLGFKVDRLMRKSVENKEKLVDRYICSLLKGRCNDTM